MAQRAALLVDGTHVGISAGRQGMELDYGLLLKYVKQGGRGRVDGGFDRDVVVARVYVGPTANPTRGRRRFLDYLSRLGYEALAGPGIDLGDGLRGDHTYHITTSGSLISATLK